MPHDAINPPGLFNSLQYGFSQITVATGSKIICVSGQVGWDANAAMVGAGDLRAQTQQALKNLAAAMAAAGGGLQDITSLRIYIVAAVMDDTAAVREGLQQFFPSAPPTATWIGVPRLADAAFLIEIEAMAVL